MTKSHFQSDGSGPKFSVEANVKREGKDDLWNSQR